MSFVSLWKHSPLWRNVLGGAIALSVLVIAFPPGQQKGVTSYPNGPPDLGAASYTPQPPPPSQLPSPPVDSAAIQSAPIEPKSPPQSQPMTTAPPPATRAIAQPISPPFGSVLTSTLVVGGKTMSLPEGQWTDRQYQRQNEPICQCADGAIIFSPHRQQEVDGANYSDGIDERCARCNWLPYRWYVPEERCPGKRQSSR